MAGNRPSLKLLLLLGAVCAASISGAAAVIPPTYPPCPLRHEVVSSPPPPPPVVVSSPPPPVVVSSPPPPVVVSSPPPPVVVSPPPPPPPPSVFWAANATGASGAASTGQGLASFMTGPPAKAVLKAEGKAAQCKTTPNFAWIPNSATPRFAELTFNLAAGTLAPRVDELVLWVMNKGKLDPPIWSIDLLLRPRGAAASSTPLRVPVFLGEDGMLGDLECPGAAPTAPPLSANIQLLNLTSFYQLWRSRNVTALGNRANITFLDVRPNSLFLISHVPGARSVPSTTATQVAKKPNSKKGVDPAKDIACYCTESGTALSACQAFARQKPYSKTKFWVLNNGFTAWVAARYPTQSGRA
ncbi:hypothetical protein GPECTOR_56g373 [Gonium pectorale]|uniref:Rhodanese domain-containing protein n=1 Tax=Gonium pectorale TaxID=33097 RepID=A0A150G606_GONPE|nr:hypothetical protein GPECTOR_56g373 [Gonium pectorale]|eukprot:KXZ45277.1 hypothetical protein GPECTOR_56g373 [Gonium pectorale]